MCINQYWFGLDRRGILKYVIVSYIYKNVLERKMYFEITHKKSASTFALIFHLKEAPGTDLEKAVRWKGEKQPPKGVLKKRCSENMQQIYRRKTKPKCDFNKVGKQLCWNHTSAYVFSCTFAAYFQNNFFLRTALDGCFWNTSLRELIPPRL